MDNNNKTFCVAPWLHLHAWPNGDAYLCCIADAGNKKSVVGDLATETIAEVINGDKMKQVRLDMLKGKHIPACKNCDRHQSLSGYSLRENFNNQYKDQIPSILENTLPDGTIKPKLLYVDFRFSNLCNLECRTCGGDLSSSIASRKNRGISSDKMQSYKDKNIVGPGNVVSYLNANNEFNDDLKQYLIDTRCFYFAGGEPLMQPEHYTILSYIHENKWFDKELRYSTNLSLLSYKKTDFVELWKDFDKVWLMCSIDHFGDQLEYIRQNVNSERLWKNFDRLINTHFTLSITFVVSIYNIYYLYDFFKFLDDNNYIDRLFSLEMLYVIGDSNAPALLPDFAKKELIEKINNDKESDLYKRIFKKQPRLETLINGLEDFINSKCSETFKNFIKETEINDATYGKDVYKTFPWLGDVITEYKSRQIL